MEKLMLIDEVCALIEEIIEAKPGSVLKDSVLAELDGWDSMTVLGMMAAVDERWHTTLAPKAIASCRTVEDLCRLIRPA